MRISREWISDYVDFRDLNASDFEELITVKVAEVEGVEEIGTPLKKALVGVVKKLSPHPVKAQLKIATVDVGRNEVQVVCGASNVAIDQAVVYVPPGGQICKGESLVDIVEREVQGVKSTGVLVSEAELGIGTDSDGILDLTSNKSAKPGEAATAHLGEPDTVLVIDNKSLTHRPDLWSHFGFAREISAVLGRPLKRSLDELADNTEEGSKRFLALGTGASPHTVKIERECGCRRFAGLEISGVTSVSSPFWMRRRLFAVGAGIRNFLVDTSNYVMLDVGQPNHFYDADKLNGPAIFIRRAKAGEEFLGLDGETRKLSAEDIVIADSKGTIALGGVIGGGPSAVSESTKRLFLESANFDPILVRQTAKRHAVRTDASNRFEKSLSAYQVPIAIHRTLEIFKQAGLSVQIHGAVSDDFPEKPESIQVEYNPDYLRTRLGTDIEDKKLSGILHSLQFLPTKGGSKSGASLSVPYYRATKDVNIPDDFVEEVGRMYGYSNIPEQVPLFASIPPTRNELKEFEYRIQDMVTGAGFHEVQGYSFVDPEYSESAGYRRDEMFFMQNPVDATMGALRTSLIPGLIDFGVRNARYQSKYALCEFGRSYSRSPIEAHKDLKKKIVFKNIAGYERRLFGLVYVSGMTEGTQSDQHKPGADFHAVQTLIRRVVRLASNKAPEFRRLSKTITSERGESFSVLRPWMHSGRAAEIVVNGVSCGVIAELNRFAFSEVSTERAVLAEMDLELLLEADTCVASFEHLPKFPDSFFEMSVVMPKKTEYNLLEKFVRKNVDAQLLRRIEVLTTYEGAPLGAGEKSVSVKLFLGSEDRTLSREELTGIQESLMKAVKHTSAEYPFSLRT